jgi:HK97 family phage major capsid protein
MEANEMRRKRAALHDEAKEILKRAMDAKRELTEAERKRVDTIYGDVDRLKADGERMARSEAEEAYLAQSAGRKVPWGGELRAARERAAADADAAVRAWALHGRGQATRGMLEAADRFGIDPASKELDLRALSEGTNTAGGYSVGYESIRAFDDAEKYFGPVRNLARVITTETGATLPIPTIDDTSNTAEIVTEASGITTTADPAFGQVNLKPFQYVSKAVVVSQQLLQDSAIPLAEVLFAKLGERIGRKQNADFTAGGGTSLPFGIQVQASLGKTASATNAITWDEVFDLQGSVDPAYANRPGCGFMMHPSTATYLRKLKGQTSGNYIWTMDVQGPSPDQANAQGIAGRISGFPVYLNPDMDSAFTTSKRLVLFGDFASYWIQDAGGARIVRADELRLLTNEVVFVAFRRSDGNLVNTAAVKYLRLA